MWRTILLFCVIGIFTYTHLFPSVSIEAFSNSLEDPSIQRILDSKNERENDSLISFFDTNNPTYRHTVAMALASTQDTSAIDILGKALKDGDLKVQQRAAFALGQMRCSKATAYLLDAFSYVEQSGRDTNRMVQATILEAIGKCGNRGVLEAITANQYPVIDKLNNLLEGQAQSIYNFALRGITCEAATRKVISDFVTNANPSVPRNVRFLGANYLARAENLELAEFETPLIECVRKEKDNDILMFLVLGLSKIKTPKVFDTLKEQYKLSKDYRVRVNIVRGMSGYSYDSTRAVITDALRDTSLAVRRTAADYFLNHGQPEDALFYSYLAKANPYWEVSTVLSAASIKYSPPFKAQFKTNLSQDLKNAYEEASNQYQKAAILTALSEYAWNYTFITEQIFSKTDTGKVPNTSHVVKSTAVDAFLKLYHRKKSRSDLGSSANAIYWTMSKTLFNQVLKSDDPATLAVVAADILKHPDLYKSLPIRVGLLKEAENKMSIPNDIETIILLRKAYAKLTSKLYIEPQVPADNYRKIDWQQINVFKERPEVLIQTTKGDIMLSLFPNDAPATVTQFLEAVKAGLYNNKAFHRIVPNFVAQAGCSRGDGWGGMNPLVRSEFSNLSYDEEGCVGMAAAGKDTEGTQFFITHSPALHLDGRYTLFAKVKQGMDIVHNLSTGDTIRGIEMVK